MTPLIFVQAWNRTIAPPFGHLAVPADELTKEGDLILSRDLYGPQWFDAAPRNVGKPVRQFAAVVRKEQPPEA